MDRYNTMDQLPTLMVSGDMDATNADNTQQQRGRSQQSTAGKSSSCTQYRTAHYDDDDIELEEDEGRSGAHYTRSTDLELRDPETSCSGGIGTTDERHQDDEPDPDGAGHRSGELRCDPSELESWTCTAHLYRTGLVGDGRASTGNSGREPARRSNNIRLQMERIMEMPDKESMLQSMRRYLTEMDSSGSPVRGKTQPLVRHTILCVHFCTFWLHTFLWRIITITLLIRTV